jgi:four helix bundle protein
MGISNFEQDHERPGEGNSGGNQKKKYDLEERTEKFSLRIRDFCLGLKKDVINIEYIRQLVRSAGSVASNYIEANENLGEGDLKFRIKVCRKESKESRLWLKHILVYGDQDMEKQRKELIQEAFELENIFGAILRKLIWKEGLKTK